MAVALAAAMTLSSVAFAEAAAPGASDPGISNPGWSDLVGGSNWEETVDLTGLGPDAEVILGSDQGLAIEGTRKDFPDGVTKVTLISSIGELKTDAAKAARKNGESAAQKKGQSIETVNYGMSITLKDQNGDVIEPVNPLTVHVVKVTGKNNKSNAAAYISDDGKTAEVIVKKDGFAVESTYFSFPASHFSKYYLVTTVAAGDDETTTTTAAPGNGGGNGGFGDPGTGNTTTTQAPAADTTTKAPDVTTATPSGGNDNKPGSSNEDTTTKVPDNGTNAPDDGNNSNVGNDGNGNGADKNQATGVVLAVIPAAIAATAVVISKKRK